MTREVVPAVSSPSVANDPTALLEGVGGFADEAFGPVVETFAKLFKNRPGSGGAFAVYQHGKPVVDIWAGEADEGVPWQHNTAGVIFSATKGMASVVIHRLADRGLIDYDTPVAEYWPAFAANGKAAVTVRQVLAHEAGLSRLARIASSTEQLQDHLLMEKLLAEASMDKFAGKPAYHAVTFGWILSGLTRAITGKGMRELLQEEVVAPLELDCLHLGRPPAGSGSHAAALGGLGLYNRPKALQAVGKLPGLKSFFETVFCGPGMEKLLTGGEAAPLLDMEMPAGSGTATARSLAKVYAALGANGSVDGRRLLETQTAWSLAEGRRLTQRSNYRVDHTLFMPLMWNLGYHTFLAPGMTSGFGHVGMNGSIGWTDPNRGLAAAYVHNRMMAPAAVPMGFGLLWPKAVRAARKAGAR